MSDVVLGDNLIVATEVPASGPLPIALNPPILNDPSVQPYYVRDTQDWAIQQEHMRHNQALYTLGEYALFTLMWTIEDLEAGLAVRCSRCWGSYDGDTDLDDSNEFIRQSIANTYAQPEISRCPVCFGTTFEGGFRAQIVRPAIFTDTDQDQQKQAKGVMEVEGLSVESTSDFRVHTGDYVFRSTGERFQLKVPQRTMLRTGFGSPSQSENNLSYNISRAMNEDPTSVAYDIPPSRADVKAILTGQRKAPTDFAEVETIRGPLIPVPSAGSYD